MLYILLNFIKERYATLIKLSTKQSTSKWNDMKWLFTSPFCRSNTFSICKIGVVYIFIKNEYRIAESNQDPCIQDKCLYHHILHIQISSTIVGQCITSRQVMVVKEISLYPVWIVAVKSIENGFDFNVFPP